MRVVRTSPRRRVKSCGRLATTAIGRHTTISNPTRPNAVAPDNVSRLRKRPIVPSSANVSIYLYSNRLQEGHVNDVIMYREIQFGIKPPKPFLLKLLKLPFDRSRYVFYFRADYTFSNSERCVTRHFSQRLNFTHERSDPYISRDVAVRIYIRWKSPIYAFNRQKCFNIFLR